MTSHYTDIWNIATKCCWLRETGATCNIHCQMSLSNMKCRVEENSHQPYPTSPNKQKLLVRHILKRQMMSLCYLGKISVQNTRKRKGSEYKFWFIPSEIGYKIQLAFALQWQPPGPLEEGCSELRGAAAKTLWHVIELLFNLSYIITGFYFSHVKIFGSPFVFLSCHPFLLWVPKYLCTL